ncbi:LysR family transcriptional regulator [Aquincola sp. J276]|uniref:LysR family transcriptional regulator n=1 Tax=Aquincola sp. J276 TaxID=2898432 RepID=UPI002151F46D|nr:LysR family transcriptional regulator [Aquincola sp. J276]MCR5867682.1 LysR family transcriptional regulator [Aquincola sp. J276]
MNLSWLEDFLALAATGNFSRAAEERHMTQPAFSRRIRALEEWLGVVLFDRSTQPATLTETGQWFRTVAQDMLARIDRIPDEARAMAAATSATLRFASTHALSFTFLPGWLRGLEAHTTVGPIQLVSDVLQQCEALMQQGRVQFLLCHGHAEVPGRLDPATHLSAKVGSDWLLPVSAPDADGRPRHALQAGAAARVPVLAYSSESGIGRLVRALRGPALDQAGGEPVVTAHLASVLRTMTLDGRGLAWLPHSLVRDDLDGGRLVVAGDEAWRIEVDVRLFRRRAAAPPVAERFWAAVLQAIEARSVG